MSETMCLDQSYSTTRLLVYDNSKIPVNSEEDKIMSDFQKSEKSRGQGGLRNKGYFKRTYDAKPLISIITVVFNGEKYLEETIKSVLDQTYDNIEFIIIDGDSTDNTIDIINRYDDQIDYWLSEPDKGIYDAWNKGLELAGGDWIAFLGADDIYFNDAITKYVDYILKQNTPLDYISSKIISIDEKGKHLGVIGKKWEWKTFKKFMKIAHVGSLHNKNLFQEVGMYNIQYKIAGDYELLLRKKENLKTAYLDVETVYMRNIGVSNTMVKKVLLENAIAKITTAKRNKIIVTIEYFYNRLSYLINKIIK